MFTHGYQKAKSIYRIVLDGIDSGANIVSKAVAQDFSEQTLRIKIVGKNKCSGHSECDAILMDKAKVSALPSLDAFSTDAELVHEAAIGKIAGEQIIKLMTLGLNKKEAESKIINGFLK